jgi:hypothetical protein
LVFNLFEISRSNEWSRRYVLSLLSELLKRRTASGTIATMIALLYAEERFYLLWMSKQWSPAFF